MAGRKNINAKVHRRNEGNQRRRLQQELDGKRQERSTGPLLEGHAPSKYRAKRSGGVAPQKPRRHLRRAERENYIPAVGAAD